MAPILTIFSNHTVSAKFGREFCIKLPWWIVLLQTEASDVIGKYSNDWYNRPDVRRCGAHQGAVKRFLCHEGAQLTWFEILRAKKGVFVEFIH